MSRAAGTATTGFRPAARRRNRIAAGVAIGAAAIAGNVLVYAGLDDDEAVLQATQDIPAGTRIESDMVRSVDASVDGPTMLVFLAHWCPHCNAELGKLVQLEDEGRVPDGVNVVAVSSLVSPDRANYPPDQWLADAGWPFPTIVDELGATGSFVAADAFGLRGVPYTILLDGDGLVTARWAGERPLETIEGALRSLAG